MCSKERVSTMCSEATVQGHRFLEGSDVWKASSLGTCNSKKRHILDSRRWRSHSNSRKRLQSICLAHLIALALKYVILQPQRTPGQMNLHTPSTKRERTLRFASQFCKRRLIAAGCSVHLSAKIPYIYLLISFNSVSFGQYCLLCVLCWN